MKNNERTENDMRKNLTNKVKKLITDPSYRFTKLRDFGLYNRLSDKDYLEKAYYYLMNRRLNLASPKAYTEKLQWLKLYDRRDVYTSMVDKANAKTFICDVLGTDEFCIDTLGVWKNTDEIDIDKLPRQFVLKCTHDSGGIVICKDKETFNWNESRKVLEHGLKSSFYLITRESQYKNVIPQIIGEPYVEDNRTGELRDYKFFCFDGKAKALFVATDRQKPGEETKFDFFDIEYNHLPIINGHPNAAIPPEKPLNFDLMIALAEKVSAGFPHVRVDFYEANGKLYIGELTLHHFSGFTPFIPDEWDYKFGDWLTLPINENLN